MNITVIGTGYVGLVTGTCFAETGNTVYCVDIDAKKVANLNQGIIPIYEPGLSELLDRNVSKERLFFTTDLKTALDNTDIVFIAVGTPPSEDGSTNLSFIKKAAQDIAQYLTSDMVVVVKSTVPVGTCDLVESIINQEIQSAKKPYTIHIVSNPEFLKEGSSVQDFLKPDRIIVGTKTQEAAEVMQKLYRPFTLNGHPIYTMDVRSSELTKYAANAMLAVRISFINEIANLCEKVGADITQVKKGIGSDPRIGDKFINPGIGYGGSCFPKDVKSLTQTGQQNKFPMHLLSAVETVNNRQKLRLFEKAFEHFNGELNGKKIAMWGLAFKPQTDDLREAPSLNLIEKFNLAGVKIAAYDPVAAEKAKTTITQPITYSDNQYDVLKDADALVICTEWAEFRSPDFEQMKANLASPTILDGRNIYNPEKIRNLGFTYYGIGIPSPEQD